MQINSIHSSVKISLNVFEGQIVYSNFLLRLEECGLQIVNAMSSSINNKVLTKFSIPYITRYFPIMVETTYSHVCFTSILNIHIFVLPCSLYQYIEDTYICMMTHVSNSGKFNMDNLYEKFGHLILDHEADLRALDSGDEEYKVWPIYAMNLHKINYVSTINLVTKYGLDVNDLKERSMEDCFTFQIQKYKSSSTMNLSCLRFKCRISVELGKATWMNLNCKLN